MEEGISHEACSLAGKLKLDKLCLVYDSNNITIEGTADLALADDTRKRFEAYGWKVLALKTAFLFATIILKRLALTVLLTL